MLEKNHFPELIFGIAGPIGVDIDAISLSLSESLRRVSYSSDVIKLTADMMAFHSDTQQPEDRNDYAAMMHFKMSYADDLCERRVDPACLARIAIQSIREHRKKRTKEFTKPVEHHAYIVRQFKRPEEITIMRTVYGRQFILISAYAPASSRRSALENRIRRTQSTTLATSAILGQAEELIERDASEGDKYAGQQLRDTFHLGDVFINGLSRTEMDEKLARFVAAFFGRTDCAPTKDEFGMYAAKSASLRSCDLSRQVGAAVFTTDGELIVQGCNEVPKAFGGTYWDQEEPDFRDVKIGNDPNDEHKHELLRDLFERLWKADFLSEKAKESQSPELLLNKLTSRKKIDGQRGPLADAKVMDLTEFGRVVHAEMCALCDAARLGRSVKGGVLYCTTFPCHNCTKHIIAAGIKRVVYMEPYPKSKALELHFNEIVIENEIEDKVSFVPFLGISPHRYREIFQKGKRKADSGVARRWIHDNDEPAPSVDCFYDGYIELEDAALTQLLGVFN